MGLMQMHAKAWEQEGWAKEEQKQNFKGLYQQKFILCLRHMCGKS